MIVCSPPQSDWSGLVSELYSKVSLAEATGPAAASVITSSPPASPAGSVGVLLHSDQLISVSVCNP